MRTWSWAEAQARLIDLHKATVHTGLGVIDDIASGLGPGEVWLVAGERTLVLDMSIQLLSSVVGNGLPGCVFAIEHAPEEIWRHLAARWAAVPIQQLLRSPSDETVRRLAWFHQTLPRLPITVAETNEPDDLLDTVPHSRMTVVDGCWDAVDSDFRREFRNAVRACGATGVVCVYATSRLADWPDHADTILHLQHPAGPDDGDRAGEADLRVTSFRNALRTADHWALEYRPSAGPAFRPLPEDTASRPNLGALDPATRRELGDRPLIPAPSPRSSPA